jgi:hypothetical protein
MSAAVPADHRPASTATLIPQASTGSFSRRSPSGSTQKSPGSTRVSSERPGGQPACGGCPGMRASSTCRRSGPAMTMHRSCLPRPSSRRSSSACTASSVLEAKRPTASPEPVGAFTILTGTPAPPHLTPAARGSSHQLPWHLYLKCASKCHYVSEKHGWTMKRHGLDVDHTSQGMAPNRPARATRPRAVTTWTRSPRCRSCKAGYRRCRTVVARSPEGPWAPSNETRCGRPVYPGPRSSGFSPGCRSRACPRDLRRNRRRKRPPSRS